MQHLFHLSSIVIILLLLFEFDFNSMAIDRSNQPDNLKFKKFYFKNDSNHKFVFVEIIENKSHSIYHISKILKTNSLSFKLFIQLNNITIRI